MKGRNQAVWWVVLVVSLGLNGVLARIYLRPDLPGPNRAIHVRPPSGMPGVSPGSGASPGAAKHSVPRWRDLQTEQEVKALVAELRASGVDSDVERSLAMALVHDRFARRMAELAYPADQPFWIQGAVTRTQTATLNRERDALLADVMGQEIDLTSSQERAIQAKLYGDLPPEKMRRLLDLLSAFRARRDEAIRGSGPGSPDVAAIESDQRKAISGILTPAELSEFDARQSALNQGAKIP